jgi:hypothetical protein
MTELREAALRYAANGWRVFPIHPGAKKPPLIKGWPERASKDLDQVRRWWKWTPDANIGLATAASVVVIDIDPRSGGDLSLADRDPTLTVRTPGGGLHLYYWPVGRVRNDSSGRLGDGIEVKYDRRYVLLPPSVVDGRQYEWDNDRPSAIADLPGWIPARLLETVEDRRLREEQGLGWYEVPDEIPEGGRVLELVRLAGSVWRGDNEKDLRIELHEANEVRCKPPLDDREVERIIDSALRWQR